MTTARILIVEDEHLIAQGLARRVTALGYTVVGLAASGEEVIAQATGLQPDVVLMDIGLRGAMDGIEAARHIRARAPIPVIYVSASTDAPTMARAGPCALPRSGLHGHRLAGVMTGLETGGRIWEVCTIPIVYVVAYAGEPTSIQTNTSTPGLAVCKSFDATQLQTTLAQALAAHR
jgi:CheY-like chemotaxis protein